MVIFMRMSTRILCMALAIVIISVVFAGCKGKNGKTDEQTGFSAFKEVPGVTEDEIIAVEELQKQKTSIL